MFGKGIRPLIAITTALCCQHIRPIEAAILFSGDYQENFDSLGTSGTTLPTGWTAFRWSGSGTIGAPITPGITAGTANSGGIYNTGASGDPDRALGTLASSSTVPMFGLQLLNNTGQDISSLYLTGILEQWRSGSNASQNESVVLEYSLDAASLLDDLALWSPLPGLNLDELLTTSTSAGALDGNHPDNQQSLTAELNGLVWSSDTTLSLRWFDSDNTGSDGLYALDNFRIQSTISAVPEPASTATLLIGLGCLGILHRWRRKDPIR